METTPKFLHGVFSFTGKGLDAPDAPGAGGHPGAGLHYVVPADRRAQLIYFRAGNSADAMIAVFLTRDGATLRIFPIGARAAMHVPLAVVEDLFPESRLEVLVGAPAGVQGQIVLDIGLIEI
jgi:hypothetical protein